MLLKQYDYTTTSKTGIGKTITGIKQQNTVKENRKQVERAFLDSFDWRLYRAGYVLVFETGTAENKLYLQSLAAGLDVVATDITTRPGFAADLPPGALKNLVAPALSVRALLSLAKWDSSITTYDVLNEDDKTVVRFSVERNKLVANKSSGKKKFEDFISVQPVKGYPEALQSVLAVLEKEEDLVPKTEPFYFQVLKTVGKRPGDYSSKFNVHIDPDARADLAVKSILLDLFSTMQANEQGVKDTLDTEFLHDFRVAVRRTRSALGQIKKVLPAEQVDQYRQEFAWLGDITTPVRDLDVHLLHFDTYRDSISGEQREDLEPLRVFLQKQQKLAQRNLTRQINSNRYRNLKKQWRAFLKTSVDPAPQASNAPRPIVEVADKRIWRVYKRVLEDGNSLQDTSSDADFHELRKRCKKLRYLMEFFQSLYPKKEISRLIKILKKLQDNLGEFQDLSVQITALKNFSIQMAQEDKVPDKTTRAMANLVEIMLNKKQAVHEEFAARFAKFAQHKNQARFEQLFAKPLQE
jgi:CHAD domain-containing protein